MKIYFQKFNNTLTGLFLGVLITLFISISISVILKSNTKNIVDQNIQNQILEEKLNNSITPSDFLISDKLPSSDSDILYTSKFYGFNFIIPSDMSKNISSRSVIDFTNFCFKGNDNELNYMFLKNSSCDKNKVYYDIEIGNEIFTIKISPHFALFKGDESDNENIFEFNQGDNKYYIHNIYYKNNIISSAVSDGVENGMILGKNASLKRMFIKIDFSRNPNSSDMKKITIILSSIKEI